MPQMSCNAALHSTKTCILHTTPASFFEKHRHTPFAMQVFYMSSSRFCHTMEFVLICIHTLPQRRFGRSAETLEHKMQHATCQKHSPVISTSNQ